MLRRVLTWWYRRLGHRYLRVALLLQFQLSHVIVAGGVVLLSLVTDVGSGDFVRILVVAEVLAALDNALALALVFRLVRPADAWLRGERTRDTAVRAWRAVGGLPVDFLGHRRSLPAVLNVLPIAGYATWELEQPFWPGFVVLAAGSGVVLLYGVLVRFFALEVLSQPVLRDIGADVPATALRQTPTIPLKWRLLLALPAINIISGVVVSALSADGHDLGALGLGVALSIAVAFTVSLELSLLLTRSIVGPLADLRDATRRVAGGDYGVRVAVAGSDELGQLAAGFNAMVGGLAERERLREAFGAYVDPAITARVVSEGNELAGEEVEVTVVFLDIRDFTALAERSTAREVVAKLNQFYEDVVPVLVRHGGHANKFVGDGLLAVFGAPDRLVDHADRAVAAALEVLRCVEARYGEELRIGIGVNSGSVLAGTIGGGGRVEFTVIGDVVNTAARVEEATRVTGDDVLVTDATLERLQHHHGGFVRRPAVELKGKTERVGLHAPAAPVPAAGRS